MEKEKIERKDFVGKFGRLEITLKPNFSLEWETAPQPDKQIVVGRLIAKETSYEQKNTQIVRGNYDSEEQLKENGIELTNAAGGSITAYLDYNSISDFIELVPKQKRYPQLLARNGN